MCYSGGLRGTFYPSRYIDCYFKSSEGFFEIAVKKTVKKNGGITGAR